MFKDFDVEKIVFEDRKKISSDLNFKFLIAESCNYSISDTVSVCQRKYLDIARNLEKWLNRTIFFILGYASVPHNRQFNTSIQHGSSTQGPLVCSKSVGSSQMRQFHNKEDSFRRMWRIRVEPTNLCGTNGFSWTDVWIWRIFVGQTCGTDGFWGLKRSGPCAELTGIFFVHFQTNGASGFNFNTCIRKPAHIHRYQDMTLFRKILFLLR